MAEMLTARDAEGPNYISLSPLRRSLPSQAQISIDWPSLSSRESGYTSTLGDQVVDSLPSSTSTSARDSQIDITQPTSLVSTATSSTLTVTSTFGLHDGLRLPSGSCQNDDEHSPTSAFPQSPNETSTNRADEPFISEDDLSLYPKPSRQVDYLSYEWTEEDLWSSWRHIVVKRKIYGEQSRLENASWRTWMKQKYSLRTVSPETVNWLKDCDITWLYGPLQTARTYSVSETASKPRKNLSKNNSFLNAKSILKKRSVSEIMLQNSLSSLSHGSLLQHAAAAGVAQQLKPSLQNRPQLDHAKSSFSPILVGVFTKDISHPCSSQSTSNPKSPKTCEKRHIRFDDFVEQSIAIGPNNTDGHENKGRPQHDDRSDSSADDGLIMIERSKNEKPSSWSDSRSKFAENTTIKRLEPTTLKSRVYQPDVPDTAMSHSLGTSIWRRKCNLSPSATKETLRGTNWLRDVLSAEKEDDDDLSWEPSSAFPPKTNG